MVSKKTGGTRSDPNLGSAAVSVIAFIAIENLPKASIARISAARISCWFRKFVCHDLSGDVSAVVGGTLSMPGSRTATGLRRLLSMQTGLGTRPVALFHVCQHCTTVRSCSSTWFMGSLEVAEFRR